MYLANKPAVCSIGPSVRVGVSGLLDLLAVSRARVHTRPAWCMQPTMRIARRCTALLQLARCRFDRRTDKRTRYRFNMLTVYVARV